MRVTAGRGFHGERVAFSLPSTLNRAYTDNYSVPYYIFAQIFGAFIAGMLLMGMYWPEIQAFKEASLAKGLPAVANGGVASILCPFPNPNQNNLGYLFFTEFFVDSYIVGGESRPRSFLTY